VSGDHEDLKKRAKRGKKRSSVCGHFEDSPRQGIEARAHVLGRPQKGGRTRVRRDSRIFLKRNRKNDLSGKAPLEGKSIDRGPATRAIEKIVPVGGGELLNRRVNEETKQVSEPKKKMAHGAQGSRLTHSSQRSKGVRSGGGLPQRHPRGFFG